MSNKRFFIYTAIILLCFLTVYFFLIQKKNGSLNDVSNVNGGEVKEININSENEKWTNEILNGGYIIYFRHSFRKNGENPEGDFYNVWSYDALELHNLTKKNLMAEETFLAEATCLTSDGKIQAKTIGKYFKILDINFNRVIASPSCRARQHAIAAFNRVDKYYNELVHFGPWKEDQNIFQKKIRKILIDEKPQDRNNTIIVAHNGVLNKHIFDEYPQNTTFYVKQGGLYVIKVEEDKIILKHKFNELHEFTQNLLYRPKNK